MIQLFLLSLIIGAVHTIDTTCPKDRIIQDGVFPPNAPTPQLFPPNYHCKIEFFSLNGYAIKFNISSIFVSSTSKIVFYDSTGVSFDISTGPNNILYIPPPGGYFEIDIPTETTAQLMVQYEYVDLTKYLLVELTSGDPLQLSLRPDSYYTWYTYHGNGITIHTDGSNSNAFKMIHVFEGDDLTGDYIGNIQQFADQKPMRKTVTNKLSIIDFYNLKSEAYVIANDYHALEQYDQYSFSILTPGIPYFPTTYSENAGKIAHTIYSPESSEIYLSSALFHNTDRNFAKITFYPMSPSYYKSGLIEYNSDSTSLNPLLPQQFPSKLITFVTDKTSISMRFENDDKARQSWLTVAPGRFLVLMSPSFWGPENPYDFDYTFKSDKDVRFTYLIDKLNITKAGGFLDMSIGTGFEKHYDCKNNQPTCIYTNIASETGLGNSMHAISDSQAFIHIQITESNGPTVAMTTGTPGTTPATTKAGVTSPATIPNGNTTVTHGRTTVSTTKVPTRTTVLAQSPSTVLFKATSISMNSTSVPVSRTTVISRTSSTAPILVPTTSTVYHSTAPTTVPIATTVSFNTAPSTVPTVPTLPTVLLTTAPPSPNPVKTTTFLPGTVRSTTYRYESTTKGGNGVSWLIGVTFVIILSL